MAMILVTSKAAAKHMLFSTNQPRTDVTKQQNATILIILVTNVHKETNKTSTTKPSNSTWTTLNRALVR